MAVVPNVPEIVVRPDVPVETGLATTGAADVSAGAGAALSGADLAGASVAAGPLGLMSLVNLFDPSFFGGSPGASPAQIQQNQINLATQAGYPGTPAGVQAFLDATFKQQFGLNAPQLPSEFSALNQPMPSSAVAPTATTALNQPSPVIPEGSPQFPITSQLTAGPSALTTMGGGGDLSPEDAAAAGAPAVGTGGGTPADVRMLGGSTGELPAGTSLTTAPGEAAGAQDFGRALYSDGKFQGIEGVAPAAEGGGGILGTGVSWGDALRFGGPLAALGMLGATMARGPAPLPSAAQQQLGVTGPGSPVYAVSQKYLTEASTGNLQPGETAQIEQYRQNSTNQLYQQLANEGVTDPRQDSRFVQGQQAIEQNAQIMYQGFINAAVTNGINALGPTTTALTNAAQLQMEQDQAYRAALASATQAFGISAALSTIGSRTA